MNVSQRMGEPPIDFYLLTESSFHPSYLVTKWVQAFEQTPGFRGCIIRADRPANAEQRIEFHRDKQQKKQLSEAEFAELRELYGGLSKTEEAMIRKFGIPPECAESFEETLYLGEDLKGPQAFDWLQAQAAAGRRMMFFIFLDKMLAPWWIEFAEGRIINSHSAVLPFARGFYAIENMAIRGDIDSFRQVVGATTHYIDTGIDTGPIIRAKQIKDPFTSDSIWEVKARCFELAFDVLIETAREIVGLENAATIGLPVNPSIVGPVFFRKDFTPEKAELAEQKFLEMKQSLLIGAQGPMCV